MSPGRAALPFAFGMLGVVWGAWQAVLPDLARRFDLGTGPLGLMLTAGFALSLPVMLVTGRFLDRAGAARTVAVTAVGMGVGLALVGTLAALPVLVIGIVIFASGGGAFDVAINGAAVSDPTWSRPARLTLLHAAFSGGGVAGALGGGLFAGGPSFQLVYPILVAAALAVAVLAVVARWASTAAHGSVPRRIAVVMLPLALIAGLAYLVEGSMETWSALYLRDVLGAAAFVGALGPAVFHAAMLTGRLVGAGVAGRLGGAGTLLASGCMTVGGMIVALASPAAEPAIVGMAVAALGASFVVPVVISIAGRAAGPHAGRASSYVLSLGYTGFLIGPSLVGILGELAGLRVALLVIPLSAVIIVLASRTAAVSGSVRS